MRQVTHRGAALGQSLMSTVALLFTVLCPLYKSSVAAGMAKRSDSRAFLSPTPTSMDASLSLVTNLTLEKCHRSRSHRPRYHAHTRWTLPLAKVLLRPSYSTLLILKL